VVWYLDTSAFLKLIAFEDETSAMRKWFESHGPIWSSRLLQTEAIRAGRRLGIDIDILSSALDAVSMVMPANTTFYTAGRLLPLGLRTLDALHIATALEIGDELKALVAYDKRMIQAAEASSIEVVTPS